MVSGNRQPRSIHRTQRGTTGEPPRKGVLATGPRTKNQEPRNRQSPVQTVDWGLSEIPQWNPRQSPVHSPQVQTVDLWTVDWGLCGIPLWNFRQSPVHSLDWGLSGSWFLVLGSWTRCQDTLPRWFAGGSTLGSVYASGLPVTWDRSPLVRNENPKK